MNEHASGQAPKSSASVRLGAARRLSASGLSYGESITGEG